MTYNRDIPAAGRPGRLANFQFMSQTPASPDTASAAPMGLLARCIGIMTSPRATFQSVAAHPKWLGALLVVTIIVAAGVSLPLTTEAGQQSQLDNQVRAIEGFGGEVNAEMYASMKRSMRFAPVQTFVTILIMGPLMSVIFSGILFGMFTVFGGQATFKQLFAVYVHSTVVTAVAQIFTGPLNYFRGSMSSATNLAVLLPMVSDQSFLGRLLGMIDLFWIWWLIVLSIGLAVLYARRTQSIAYILFGIYALGAVLIATVMNLFGRSN
jgi:hypothetical protein